MAGPGPPHRLNLRIYRAADQERVAAIFATGIGLQTPGVAKQLGALRGAQLAAIGIPVLGAAVSRGSRWSWGSTLLTVLASAAIVPATLWLAARYVVDDYIRSCLKDDLSQIDRFYSPSGAGAGSVFLVAEVLEVSPSAAAPQPASNLPSTPQTPRVPSVLKLTPSSSALQLSGQPQPLQAVAGPVASAEQAPPAAVASPAPPQPEPRAALEQRQQPASPAPQPLAPAAPPPASAPTQAHAAASDAAAPAAPVAAAPRVASSGSGMSLADTHGGISDAAPSQRAEDDDDGSNSIIAGVVAAAVARIEAAAAAAAAAPAPAQPEAPAAPGEPAAGAPAAPAAAPEAAGGSAAHAAEGTPAGGETAAAAAAAAAPGADASAAQGADSAGEVPTERLHNDAYEAPTASLPPPKLSAKAPALPPPPPLLQERQRVASSGDLLKGAAASTPGGATARATVVGHVGLARKTWQMAEVKRLSVDPRYRRMGIGRKLMDAIVRHARDAGFKELELSTSSVNPEALQLYQTTGWELKHTHEEFGITLYRFRMDLVKRR